jgi:O-antigen/teichoic acid export membrane protein
MRNAGLLLTGKAASGLMQLLTFALAARGLGLTEFGLFSMLLAQVQLLTGLAAFQSNQAVVRYGVQHLNSGNRRAFQALLKAGTLLDLGAAIAATVAAILLAPVIGGWLGWNDQLIGAAQLIAPLAFTNAIATPKGILRLFGRFDLLAKHVTVTPAARLLGVGIAYAAGAPLTTYLALWLAAGLIGAVVGLWLAWREAARQGMLGGMDLSMNGLTAENPGLWGFTIISNIHSTFALIPNQLATFLAGALLAPAAAGLFKVAQELGTGLAKPVDLLNQSVYPDVARLVAARQWKRLKRTIFHAGAIAAGASAAVTLLMLLAGEPLISTVFGPAYVRALDVLILILIATTISVSAFAVDPALYAFGKTSRPLFTALAANAVFVAVLVFALPEHGIIAGGWAYLAASGVTVAMAALWLRATLRENAGARPV